LRPRVRVECPDREPWRGQRTQTALRIAGAASIVIALTACTSGKKSSSATLAAATPTVAAATSASLGTPASTPPSVAAAADPVATTSATTAASPSSAGGGSSSADACSLLTLAQASALVGDRTFTAAVPSTLAPGQDQCAYAVGDDSQNMDITVYQSNSGVTFDMAKTVNASVGAIKTVSGVGDQAVIGTDELDAQAGSRVISVEGCFITGAAGPAAAIAVTKAIIAALG
jgi:hypothetical protein